LAPVSLDLPFVDAHAISITAPADVVWHTLVRTVEGAFAGGAREAYARAIGCVDVAASGPRPLAVGSTIPGFHVVTSTPGSELVLEGRHRCSIYRLVFGVEARDEARSLLRAETWAEFPGVLGTGYRLVVVGSGGHRIVVRRLLAAVGRRAEARQDV
jgi:hypothetical protein